MQLIQLKFKEDDFQSFQPVPYLEEYFQYPPENYGGVGPENDQFLQFFAQVALEYSEELDNALLLDFGCGPTIYSILSLGRHCGEIHMSDYLQQNLEQVKLWTQESQEAFDWNPYVKRALELEQNSTDREAIAARATSLRSKITSIKQGNIRDQDPVGTSQRGVYDVVVSSFCLEGVAQDLQEWRQLVANLTSTLKPGGLLVFATQIEADGYRISDGYGEVVNLTEQDLLDTLIACGFEGASIITKELDGGDNHPEYEKFLMATAKLN